MQPWQKSSNPISPKSLCSLSPYLMIYMKFDQNGQLGSDGTEWMHRLVKVLVLTPVCYCKLIFFRPRGVGVNKNGLLHDTLV